MKNFLYYILKNILIIKMDKSSYNIINIFRINIYINISEF